MAKKQGDTPQAGPDPASTKWKYDIYFPHKAGARNDPKLVKVFLKFNYLGIGVYWSLLEILREQPDHKYPAEDLDALAHTMGLGEIQLVDLMTVFVKVDLIKKEGGFYYSPGLLANMDHMRQKSEKARASVAVRWDKIKRAKNESNTNVQRTNNVGNTNGIQVKNSKVNPSKEGLSLHTNLPVSNQRAEAPAEALSGLVSAWPFESQSEKRNVEDLVAKILPERWEEIGNELNDETVHDRITYVFQTYPGGIVEFLEEKSKPLPSAK